VNLDLGSFGSPGRNQFLLGPAYLQRDSWHHFDLGEHLKLSVHADLDIEQATTGQCRLTLLGYMLDWSHPEASNAEILKSLADNSPDLVSCLKATAELGGRWVLVYQDNAKSVVFHDAAGLRQVCYANDSAHKNLWIGSQPGLLDEIAGLRPDRDALSFIESMASTDPEYWWPGNRTLFAAASALLPNHYLDLSNGSCDRYWPWSEPESLSMAECRRRAADKLVGVISAAQNRWDLTLGLSAGWDSRLLLAASRNNIENMTVHTVRTAAMEDDHNDVVVPRKLAKRLKLDHVEIRHPEHASDEFMQGFRSHTWRPHQRFAAGAQAEFNQFQYTKVAVIGNLSEVAKLPYRHQLQSQRPLDGKALAALVGMGDHDFAIEAMDEWLEQANELAGYNVLDLFYWEQRIGRWLAANFIDFDFAWKDIFVPFNIRSLICDLLAVDEKDRVPGSLYLYVDIMQSLWPEVLQEPINPRPKSGLMRRILRRLRRSYQ